MIDLTKYPYDNGLYLLVHQHFKFKNESLSEEYVKDLNDMFLYTDEQFVYLVKRLEYDTRQRAEQLTARLKKTNVNRIRRELGRKKQKENNQEAKLARFKAAKQSVG